MRDRKRKSQIGMKGERKREREKRGAEQRVWAQGASFKATRS